MPRPRGRAWRLGSRYVARVYNPDQADPWKAAIVAAALKHRPCAPLLGPIGVRVEFYMPRPKRLLRKSSPRAACAHTGKPDADNLAKVVLDALGKVNAARLRGRRTPSTVPLNVGYWNDDAQVCSLMVQKYYAALGQEPGATIEVVSLG